MIEKFIEFGKGISGYCFGYCDTEVTVLEKRDKIEAKNCKKKKGQIFCLSGAGVIWGKAFAGLDFGRYWIPVICLRKVCV